MRVRIADVLRAGADAFLSSHAVPGVVRKALWALLACRSAVLGGHAGVCEAGHISVWYNACRHRICPRCAYVRVQRWLERQARILLSCAHHHIIFTVPHELNRLWQLNQALLGDLLFASAREALFELAADGRYLGARPGALMALHTWGQQLALHPHVHCLVTAGGVDDEGRWRHCRRRHFLPAEPLKRLFRGKLLAGLQRLAERGELRLPEGWTLVEVEHLREELAHKRWNVHVRERYRDATAVLSYLGRYLNGGPMAEGRLVACEDGRVSFRYKDYRAGGVEKVMSLPAAEFARRYLQHVPPQGFHMVRGFGLYRRGSQNNQLRDAAADHLGPASPPLVRVPPADPCWQPTAGQTPCATCGVPVRCVSKLKPRTRPLARPGPVLAA